MKNSLNKIIIAIVGIAIMAEGLFIKALWQISSPNWFRWGVAFSLLSFLYFLFYSIRLLSTSGDMKKAMLNNEHYGASGLMILLLVPKLLTGIVALIDDILFLLFRVMAFAINIFSDKVFHLERQSYLVGFALFFSVFIFFSILYGIIAGRFRFRVHRVPLQINNLSTAPTALQMVQISDFHIGSFKKHKKQVVRIVDKINSLQPDLVCFTGDLVNIFAEEAVEFVDVLKKIEAPLGKFAILGNHDYGEYYSWPSKKAHEENTEKLLKVLSDAGFKLLLNEHTVIRYKDIELTLAGVENWGKPPFPQYGDIDKALENKPENLPVVLMSHDPTHWDYLMNHSYKIDLTLSGHTHGMQFGIEIGKLKWSPVKYRYPRWAGLYSQNERHLYVNRGIGFIGFPGRVGIWPEITLFTLSGKK